MAEEEDTQTEYMEDNLPQQDQDTNLIQGGEGYLKIQLEVDKIKQTLRKTLKKTALKPDKVDFVMDLLEVVVNENTLMSNYNHEEITTIINQLMYDVIDIFTDEKEDYFPAGTDESLISMLINKLAVILKTTLKRAIGGNFFNSISQRFTGEERDTRKGGRKLW